MGGFLIFIPPDGKFPYKGLICNRQLDKIMVNYLGDILCCVGPEAAVAGECRECCANGAVGHLTARNQRCCQTTRYPWIFSSSILLTPPTILPLWRRLLSTERFKMFWASVADPDPYQIEKQDPVPYQKGLDPQHCFDPSRTICNNHNWPCMWRRYIAFFLFVVPVVLPSVRLLMLTLTNFVSLTVLHPSINLVLGSLFHTTKKKIVEVGGYFYDRLLMFIWNSGQQNWYFNCYNEAMSGFEDFPVVKGGPSRCVPMHWFLC